MAMAKILVIEDDPQMRQLLRRALEGAGHEVIDAENGAKGLKRFGEGRTDLVVTDIIMPDKEGIQTIIELKQSDPSIKVLGISGGGRTENLEFLRIARRSGADRVMAKPFRTADFVKAVTELLEGAPGAGQEGAR
jgi:CheY-like chemotaxis protein